MKHQVFLSFRGEDTRLNFTSHLLKALKDTGMNVFFDEETLERGEQISPALSNAIVASNLSIIILSKDYASSKSCLAEVSCIMDCNRTQQQIVLPIFYHVDPSDVRNLGGSFKTSFNDHESKSLDQVQGWKNSFAEVGKLKGWHIEGGKFDRPETDYIKDIVEYVIKKLMNNKSSIAFEELRENTKTRDEIFRNNFLSKVLNQEIHILTPSIGSTFIRERLNNKKGIIIDYDVDDLDLLDYLGVKHLVMEINKFLRVEELTKYISFDELDELDNNLFLDIACFFKGNYKDEINAYLTLHSPYMLGNITLLSTREFLIISMHDLFGEMGKDFVHQEAIGPEKCSKLWSLKNVYQALRYNKVKKIMKLSSLIRYNNQFESESAYIKDIVEDVVEKLMNRKFGSGSGELVGIDDQKEMVLKLMEQAENRVIGIWGMGGIGKTTLADAVYKEVSPKFEGRCFLQNVCDKLEKQGMESLRNDLLSELLNKKIQVSTITIGSNLIQERLNNKRVFVVLDDVNDSDLIDYFGIQHFGDGSKILVTSRDKQILKNGVDKIYEVKKLNENHSLQLFSKFAFKQLNPLADFRDLLNKFVTYAQGSPLALKVLGSRLYQRPKEEWESAIEKLKEYPESKIFKVLKTSFDGLDELEKNIFLDIAFFFNHEKKDFVVEMLSHCYNGALCGISNLLDKCLLNSHTVNKLQVGNTSQFISMHDLLEEMGRDIVRQESKDPGKRSRLRSPKDVHHVLKYNKTSQIDNLRLGPTICENILNVRFLNFYFPPTDNRTKL
ncbi:hypothetical protein CXB51_025368 [Gossypium anomalum]|uniref:TIR domain-containing protein n=1 Tax=Gossypium anomalum TaxID=47600 RepID=A0A8J5Z1X6_9ROSI|nr:hypothetical protein CXB51_025368 [Gossypium anomalum]